jgi:transcriptional regulator with XRE-family HTH domain|uniref:Cupin domain-containing protein n=1 Tax=Mesoaciditoga lauensis TaxID=1495039 RepID=A0A7V3VSJ5_9BACT
MEIGAKVKRLRLSKGFTQEELAERADLTKGFISLLERDKTSPSIATFEQILNVLGVSLRQFFSEELSPKVAFTKKDRVPLYDEPEGVKTMLLIQGVEDKKIDPKLVIIKPEEETSIENYHQGEEFGYVIEGNVELWLDDERYKLKNGECFYYKADHKHQVRNISKSKKAILLWITID